MISVKVIQVGRTEKSTHTYEGSIESLPKVNNPLKVFQEGKLIFETDSPESVIHHYKENAYTVKVGRHKIRVEVKAS